MLRLTKQIVKILNSFFFFVKAYGEELICLENRGHLLSYFNYLADKLLRFVGALQRCS